MLRHIGVAQLQARRAERAIATLGDAVRETFALPEADDYNLARARTCLAEAYLAIDRPRKARPLLEAALQVMTERGATYQQAVIHRGLASTTKSADEARHHLRAALALLDELAHPDCDEVAALLEEHPAGTSGTAEPGTAEPGPAPHHSTPSSHGESSG